MGQKTSHFTHVELQQKQNTQTALKRFHQEGFLYTAQGTLFCTITSGRIFALRLKINELCNISVCVS